MRNISIKIKIPLVFTIISIVIFLVSIVILSFFTQKKIELANIRLLSKFAISNSYELLMKNKPVLNSRINIWMNNEKYVKKLYFIDHKMNIIAPIEVGVGSIDYRIKKFIKRDIGKKQRFFQERLDNKSNVLIMPIRIGEITIGYLFAIIKRDNIIDILLDSQDYIKFSAILIFIMGSLVVIATAYLLSSKIVEPIMEIINYINLYTHTNPLSIKPIPLKNHLPCWQVKNCTKKCKAHNQFLANCWEKYFNINTIKKRNPMSFPCYECEVFLRQEKDEMEKLKIFLNQLISSIQFHYQKNKMYSTSLEEMIGDRTKELQGRTDELLAETKKSQLIINNIIEGILVTDLDCKLLQINSNAIELLKIKKDLRESHDYPEVVEFINNPLLAQTILQIINDTISNKTSQVIEFKENYEGTEQFLLIKTSLIQDGKTNTNMVICLIEDITNNKLLDHFKNEFFNTISHDLKNPLTSVVGFLDLVLHGPDNDTLSERHRKLLNFAFHSSEDLQRMILDLSDLVRLQTNKIKLNKITFPVKDFFYELEDAFYPKLVENRITLEYSVIPDNLLLYADYYRLKQVFSNLIGNAVKAGSGITVYLKAEEQNNQIVMIVQDTGNGIPPEKLPFIFEKFTRLYTYQDKSEGLGLGLSIVKTLVNLHNGNITVESVITKGTTFTIAIPKA